MKNHNCAVIADEDMYINYLFVDTTEADVEEMILAFSEEDLDNYIQEYQECEYEGHPEWGPDFWMGMSRGKALFHASYNYTNVAYFDGVEL